MRIMKIEYDKQLGIFYKCNDAFYGLMDNMDNIQSDHKKAVTNAVRE